MEGKNKQSILKDRRQSELKKGKRLSFADNVTRATNQDSGNDDLGPLLQSVATNVGKVSLNDEPMDTTPDPQLAGRASKNVSVGLLNISDNYGIGLSDNITTTTLGLCYDPRPPKSVTKSVKSISMNSLPLIKMKDSNRANFASVLKSNESKKTTVMIVGEMYMCEVLKQELIEADCDFPLNVYCGNNTFTKATIKETDFFIFLVHLDRIGSIVDVTDHIVKIKKQVSCIGLCSAVVEVVSNAGPYADVILTQEKQNFLSTFRMYSYIWSENTKHETADYLLQDIKACVGSQSSMSHLINWNLRIGIKAADV